MTGPEEKIVLEGEKERQGDFVFTAQRAGDYKFCFNNEMSTYSDKVVDFEIAVSIPIMDGATCMRKLTPYPIG